LGEPGKETGYVRALPLFPLRNSCGLPWTHNAIRIRFRNLRKKLGLPKGVVATAMRHTWVTDALEAGIPIATVSELAGHRSTRMVEQVYSKLSERKSRHCYRLALASRPRR